VSWRVWPALQRRIFHFIITGTELRFTTWLKIQSHEGRFGKKYQGKSLVIMNMEEWEGEYLMNLG
jgi:hypothetical protein